MNAISYTRHIINTTKLKEITSNDMFSLFQMSHYSASKSYANKILKTMQSEGLIYDSGKTVKNSKIYCIARNNPVKDKPKLSCNMKECSIVMNDQKKLGFAIYDLISELKQEIEHLKQENKKLKLLTGE